MADSLGMLGAMLRVLIQAHLLSLLFGMSVHLFDLLVRLLLEYLCLVRAPLAYLIPLILLIDRAIRSWSYIGSSVKIQ